MSERDEFQERVKQAFTRQQLDDATRDDLRSARQRALEIGPRRPPSAWLPTAAVAALVLTVSALMLLVPRDADELPPVTVDEFAVLTGEDELELFEELEFYIWLDGEDNV